MSEIKEIKKGNWKVTVSLGFDDNGKRKRVAKQGFKTKAEAKKYEAEILAKYNKGYDISSNGNVLLKDFIYTWFNEYKILKISINTKNDYISRINSHIIPMLGSYKLKDITTAVVQNFYNKLISEKNLKPVSAKKVYDILNGCLKYAKKLGYIYILPTDIEKQKCEKPDIQFWTKEEIDFFLKSIKGTYLYTPILVDVLTGLRIAELCGLRWKDIDLENGFLEVNSQVINDKANKTLVLSSILKTNTSHRIISIPNVLIKHLKAIKTERNATKNDFVIVNRKGTMCTPRNLSMEFTKKIKHYKEPLDELQEKFPDKDFSNYMQLKQITFHGLRHTHATLLIFNGENIKVVSDRLGHRDINITLNTYTHVMEDMKNNTAKLLDNLF